MGEKVLTARKDYTCDVCGKPIKKGEIHVYMTGRAPKYDDSERQIGICYWSARACIEEMKGER